MNRFYLFLFLCFGLFSKAQHSTEIIAHLNASTDQLIIKQQLTIRNNSKVAWSEVYLMDWANAFSAINTPLAVRFAEDFKNRFQFSNSDEKGSTQIATDSLINNAYTLFRVIDHPDVLKMALVNQLLPSQEITVALEYTVTIPDDVFTGYGKNSIGDYAVKDWYLHPAVFNNGTWNYYSHKGLNDFYGSPMDFSISLHLPDYFKALSSVPMVTAAPLDASTSYLFEGQLLEEAHLYITKNIQNFKEYNIPGINITTDLNDSDIPFELKLIFMDRVSSFLTDKLGNYGQEHLFITDKYYRENPVYGLNSLPNFFNPYPDGFTYELRILKGLARKWVEAGLNVNPREEAWIEQSMLIYLMMQYQELYYPDLKISGKLENIWGIRGFNASQLMFNDQYPLIYLNSARLNIDQAINTPADELVKYNEQLGSPYKGAIGLYYLNDYLGDDALEKSIRQIFKTKSIEVLNEQVFKNILTKNTSKPVDWFFTDYIATHKRMDWKIKNFRKKGDSVEVTIKNKSKVNIPVTLYTLNNDSIVSKRFINYVQRDTTVTLSRKHANRISINYEKLVPEFNQRDNYKTLKGFPSFNRPIEFRLIKDAEDPEKSQVFLIPEVQYNLYDGLTIGSRFYNGNLLPKPFRYSIKPAYGLASNKLVGSVAFSYAHPLQDRNESIYQVRYGLSANTFSYDNDLMYRRASGWLQLGFRPKDLRSNERESLNFRNIYVDRDANTDATMDEPNYNVFAINFRHSDPNLRRFLKYDIGTEVSSKFSKVTFELEWRKLFKDSRQLNFRFFTGTFLHNESSQNGDFFSFALDRPTDYLFDYNYYGRSEDAGLFSRQLVIAEGGFKSQLEPAFANQWISTVNSSYSLWQYIFAYTDAGFVKNKGRNAKFVYDSGIRLNLLQDYFELYFPIYSNNGWEIAQENYDQKIRFIVSLDVNTFIGLFTRRWY
jgi:hypothetical protein